MIKLKSDGRERCVIIGQYVLDNNTTVRAAAKHYGISKSTVHKDITDKLKDCNYPLYCDVKAVLEQNKAERHIRGGKATKEKYRILTESNEKKRVKRRNSSI